MICDVWLSTIRLTLANTSSNGIPERAVKTFKEYLRKAINSTYADSSIKILVNIQTYTTSCHRRGTQ